MTRDPVDGMIQSAMNSPAKALVVLLLLGAFGLGYYLRGHPGSLAPAPSATQDNITVHFSPNGGCTDAVVGEIRSAQKSILVQAYSFTSKNIANSLADAIKRGVAVTLIVDKKASTEAGNKVEEIISAGGKVLVDGKHAIAHNKIMLIDGRTIITGSFNFTNQAEHSNAENLLVLHDKPQLYTAYEQNFQEHMAHSEPRGK